MLQWCVADFTDAHLEDTHLLKSDYRQKWTQVREEQEEVLTLQHFFRMQIFGRT